MTRENGLDRCAAHLREQPRTGRFVDVVVAAALLVLVDVRRVVHEQERAPPLRGAVVQLLLEPVALALLVGQAGVQQQRVQQDEARRTLVERVEIRPERRTVDRQVVVADLVGRHPLDPLVTDIVIAGQQVHRHLHLRGDVLETVDGLAEGRQGRHRMHDVAQVQHE